MFKTKILGLAFVFAGLAGAGFAQSPSEIKAQVYFFEAEDFIANNDFKNALESLDTAQSLLGGNNALLESVRARVFYKSGQFENAQASIETFYSLDPSEDLNRSLASIIIGTEKQISEIQKRRQKREAEEAEHRRLAPFINKERQIRDGILKSDGVNVVSGLVDLSGKNGADALTAGNGGPGGDAQVYDVFLERIPFTYIDDLVLVHIKNAQGEIGSAYWDTSQPLQISAKGGAGGKGGTGQAGLPGKDGRNENAWLDAKKGKNGTDGQKGGDGGAGGRGGTLNINFDGDAEFAATLSKQFKTDVSGGEGGIFGAGGAGGKGGIGGKITFGRLGKARDGYAGRKGANGVSGKKGSAGSTSLTALDSESFESRGIKRHKSTGLILGARSISELAAGPQAGSEGPDDRDARVTKQTPPIFPAKFLRGDHSGFCRMRFDISADGKPSNVRVRLCTNDVLEEPSLDNVATWEYSPKIKDGQAVDRKDVDATIVYNLNNEAGQKLPLPAGF